MQARPSTTARTTQNRFRPRLELLEARQLLSGAPIPELNSNPGAAHTLFLDFDADGVVVPEISLIRPPFDMDGDPATFTADEAATMERIWTFVAEDFAPFNINVTTVESESGKFLRVIIGG